ncbi:hypothetical protein GCM10022243_34080 [Saccharothrix violaceirubra]|uniref:AcrR family transcriptional regulator n=1 Tax=Saccharothrix violaceirubra TaxID=413306 RepID=A0A7W7T558_9PSEU|nr:TetR/AcrR family transcriptional regulator [Saccharothrix violaceirubra]MBB4966461.1 AcrR family transcriptional regulator [Saccharothrix violaceirubra]
MGRPSQKEGILAAALGCFAELGYDATRVKHIAVRAGVAESALYRHYPGKEAIAHELYADHLGRYSAALEAIAGDGVDPVSQLGAVVDEVLAAYRRQPEAFTFTLLNTASVPLSLPPGTRFPLEIVEDVIRRGQRAGVVRAGAPNLLAAIFFGCLLRPLIVATLSPALDLVDTRHDAVLRDAALSAVTRSS